MTPTQATRTLWEAATDGWRYHRPLPEQLRESSTVMPARSLSGEELYEIGVALGFLTDDDNETKETP